MLLYRFQRITIIKLLLHQLLYVLLYIFSEMSAYLYNFKRVTTRCDQVVLKGSILIFFLKKKLMVMRGNALEN